MSTPVGRHLCSLPRSFREQFDLAAPFLREGVAAGERCLFVADDNTLDVVRRELALRGLGPDDVEVVPAEATPLRARDLDAPAIYRAWGEATDAAVREGWKGLRVVVEMTWALAADLESLAGYEAGAEVVFATKPLHALCQYSQTRFPAAVLRRAAVRTHPHVLLPDGTAAAGDSREARAVHGLS